MIHAASVDGIIPLLAARLKLLNEVRAKAERNQDVYLTWDYVDVYFATSMRKRWEFEDLFDFVAGVMGQKFWKGVRPCGGADRHGAFPLFPPVDAKMSASPMPLLAILGSRAALTNKSAAWHYSGFRSIWPDHVMPGHTGGLANVNHSAMTGTHAVSTTFNNERSRFDNHSEHSGGQLASFWPKAGGSFCRGWLPYASLH